MYLVSVNSKSKVIGQTALIVWPKTTEPLFARQEPGPLSDVIFIAHLLISADLEIKLFF